MSMRPLLLVVALTGALALAGARSERPAPAPFAWLESGEALLFEVAGATPTGSYRLLAFGGERFLVRDERHGPGGAIWPGRPAGPWVEVEGVAELARRFPDVARILIDQDERTRAHLHVLESGSAEERAAAIEAIAGDPSTDRILGLHRAWRQEGDPAARGRLEQALREIEARIATRYEDRAAAVRGFVEHRIADDASFGAAHLRTGGAPGVIDAWALRAAADAARYGLIRHRDGRLELLTARPGGRLERAWFASEGRFARARPEVHRDWLAQVEGEQAP